ncbi:MAG: hypothetical protein B7Z31_12610, partial [Rhodobacterales bacterium 12-65-15]
PGANVSLGTIVINTTATDAGSATNEATITSTGPLDPDLANNTDSDGGAVIEVPNVDLEARKSGPSPALVVVGNSYDFAISVANRGNTAFFGTVVMTDSLPAGLEVTGYTQNGWTCLPAASPALPVVGAETITCTRIYTEVSPLGAGQATPPVILQTTATAEGVIVNSLTVTTPFTNLEDLNPANNTVTYGVTGSTGDNSADIATIKTADLATLPVGEVQTFTIEVTNTGPQPSTAITLTDNLVRLINNAEGPDGAGLVSIAVAANAASGVACTAPVTGGTSRRLECTIDTLPICTPGVDCPVITIAVRPGGEGGERTNTARAISSAVADRDLDNNADSATFDVEARADVTVTKADSPDPVAAGQNLTYVITAQNPASGLSSAEDVTIVDTLPADVTFLSATPSTGSCSTLLVAGQTTVAGDQVSCTLGTLSNGGQQTVTIVVRPNFLTRSTSLTNSVTVSTTTVETDTNNNEASATTEVRRPAFDLLINKDDSVDPLAIGDDTVYTITVTNLGPSAAETVTMTDVMPGLALSELSYQSHSAPGASCGTVPAVGSFGGTLECTYPVIPSGQSRIITVTARGTTKGVGINSASVSVPLALRAFETNINNNAVTEDTTVRTRADVEVVSKTATPATVNLREAIDYVIVVRNNTGVVNGNSLAEADEVFVSDTLPSGMVLNGTPSLAVTNGSTTLATCSGAAGEGSFECSLGTFSSGGVVEITVPVIVTEITTRPQNFNNTASVRTSSLDVVPLNNQNSGSVAVNGSTVSGRVFRDFADDG